MKGHRRRARALATELTAKAEDALASIDREMTVMQWPAEFRIIMWELVADIATKRAKLAQLTLSENSR